MKTRVINFDPGCQQSVPEYPVCSNSPPPRGQDALFPSHAVLPHSSPCTAEVPGTLQGLAGSVLEGQILKCS